MRFQNMRLIQYRQAFAARQTKINGLPPGAAIGMAQARHPQLGPMQTHMPLSEPVLAGNVPARGERRAEQAGTGMAAQRREYFTAREAFEQLRPHEEGLTLRAFIGRMERKSVPSIKAAGRRLVGKEVVDALIAWRQEYFTLKQAYEHLVGHEKGLNFRAFVGRVEQGSIPSVKAEGQRWIAKQEIDKRMNYYTFAQAMDVFGEHDIWIRPKTFERRLDKKQIQYEKMGGLRMIARDVLEALVQTGMPVRPYRASKWYDALLDMAHVLAGQVRSLILGRRAVASPAKKI